MEPTIKAASLVTVDPGRRTPHLGDIVLFHPPTGANPAEPACGDPDQGPGHEQPCGVPTQGESSATYIKRVIGLPGDRIAIMGGTLCAMG